MRISVVATGIEAEKAIQPRPLISLVSDRGRIEPPIYPAPKPAPAAMPAPASAAASVVTVEAEPVPPQASSIEAQAVSKGAFIAPPPVEPAITRPPVVAPAAPAPDAYAAAAMENGGRPPQKPKTSTPSLFERVAGASRLLQRKEPELTQRAAPTPPSQPKLGQLDPAERPGAKEEDLLDIPAFLRRQAN
jgi:cell division protein FtsZ